MLYETCSGFFNHYLLIHLQVFHAVSALEIFVCIFHISQAAWRS